MLKRLIVLFVVAALVSGCTVAQSKKSGETVFYPALPQQPRLQFLTTINDEGDIGRTQPAMQSFLAGPQPLNRLVRPHAIASRPGTLYVSDLGYGQVMRVDFAKKEIVPLKAEREASMKEPMGLMVADDNLLYVTDSERQQIVVFDAEDQFVRTYGDGTTLNRPIDVAAHGDRIYVADFGAHSIKVFARGSGELVQTIGGRGTEAGRFDRPTHLRVDSQGNLFVNDSFNFRIQKFDPAGTYLHSFGYHGQTLGGFARPKGFAISRAGHLYAADAGFENVQIFNDENQNLLLFFGGFGDGDGQMYLPSAVAIDYDNVAAFKKHIDKDFAVEYLIYVSNLLGNRRVNVYGFGKWTGAPLPEPVRRAPKKE